MIRTVLIGAASLALGSATPAPSSFASDARAGLDPLQQVRFTCGGGRQRGALVRARLRLAQAAGALAIGDFAAAPLIPGLGTVRYGVTTASALAQAYVNQGLALAYGFNHDAAVRAFRAAQALDPECAMCFWGEAWARGPNINAPMDPGASAGTLAALDRAMALRDRASAPERALIEALATRYSPDPTADRAALDADYADAMAGVAARFPEDNDIAILAAEAAMDTQPWDYWERDGRTPKGRIGATLARVEQVLARNPTHPQAIHLYIHLLEASAMPERAEAAADRLARPLVPGAGHLVHMPGHLFYRVGRYKDAIRVNVAAAKADEAYLRTADDRGIYRYGYYPHNVHFIVTSAQMGGDKATALDQSRRLQRVLGIDVALALPWVQVIWAAPYFAHAQFSRPEEILAQPAPDPRMPYVTGMWRYSRAVAHALRRDEAAFARELAELRRIRETADFRALTAGSVPAPELLQLAEHVARGRLSMADGRPDDAANAFRAAIAIEDGLAYMEPPYWYYPVLQSLGAAQLASGDPAAARQTFLAALSRSPNNGWALYGLAEAQRRLGEHQGRRATLAAFGKAWLGTRAELSLARL
jgi:tetratricopeptide (TPR) repeat protein